MFLMLYRGRDGRLTGRGHTGIVASTAGRVATLEGNAGNRFKLGRRDRSTIAGYVNHYGPSEQPAVWERGLLEGLATDGDATR